MRLALFSVLVLGLLFLGCSQQTPSSSASSTPLAVSSPSPSPTLQRAYIPSAAPLASPVVSPSPSASAKPSPSPSPSAAPLAATNTKDFADALSAIAAKYFGRPAPVYQPDYETFAMSDYTPKYRFDLFVRKAKYRWTPDDILSPVTSPSNKTVQALVITNPSSAYFEYNFKMLCKGGTVELEGKTRDYFFDPAKQSILGKGLAELAVDLCV